MEKVDTSKCSTCQVYGQVEGGDWVDYGSTRVQLPIYYGCLKGYDGDEETGDPIDTLDCPHYEEIPRCPKHPDEYLWPDSGCNKCLEELYREDENQ